MNRGSQVARNRPDPAAEFGNVLHFRRRSKQPPLPLSAAGLGDSPAEPSDDLAAYEQDQDEVVDYRQRMLMNVIALVIVTLLLGAGVWIADTIADLQRDQDCVMQGRVNCVPVELPAPKQQ